MSGGRREAARVGAILVVTVGCALAASCESGGARPTATVQAADTADQVLEGFSHFVTADGVRKSHIEADTAYFYEASQLALLSTSGVIAWQWPSSCSK